MEYDQDIENVYLSVIKDQRAYREAKDLLKYLKAGAWEEMVWNKNTPINRRSPFPRDVRNLANIAGVEASYNAIPTHKRPHVWLKIANHIDPDFIQLDKAIPEAKTKSATETIDGIQTEINQRMIDAASYFVKVHNSFNETQGIKMPIINNVTYFKGTDIKTLNEDQLIKAIKDLESEVESLKSIKVTSKKVASNIEEIEEAINLVVAELDSRTK